MIIAIATMKMNEDVTTQVHVPINVEIMQVPPTDKEVEKIKSVLEEETGYKFVSLDSITVELVSVKAGKNMIITWKDTETGKMFQTIE